MPRMPLPTKPLSHSYTDSVVHHWPQKELQTEPAPVYDYDNLAHCLFAPINYEAGYSYPLIVWLHSDASSELELRQVMPLISMRNFVGVAPRGTRSVPKASRRYGWGHSPSEIADTCQMVRACIATAQQQYNIHTQRIFIAGYGTGGTLALRVGMEHPELFTGAVSLGGPVPRGGNPFRRINHARQLPLMLSVSPSGSGYDMPQVREDLRLLHSAGFELSLRLYPEESELTTVMLSDLNSWVMELACSSTIVSCNK